MQGGLAQSTTGVSVTSTGSGPPDPTGVPTVPEETSAPVSASTAGAGPGATVAVNTDDLGPIDTLLAGTSWTMRDLELTLQTISTVILVAWAIGEAMNR